MATTFMLSVMIKNKLKEPLPKTFRPSLIGFMKTIWFQIQGNAFICVWVNMWMKTKLFIFRANKK